MMRDPHRRSPDSVRRRRRERRNSREQQYQQQPPQYPSYDPQQQQHYQSPSNIDPSLNTPTNNEFPTTNMQSYTQQIPIRSQRRRAPSSSLSSSSSSSYLDISRRYPVQSRFGGILNTFFRAPSERHRRRRRSAKNRRRILYFGNSSSSSVNSDMAYGTGFIKRPKSRSFSPRSGSGSGAPNQPRPAEYDASRPAGPRRDKTDEEILALGRQLSDMARRQNDEDLRVAGRSRPSALMSTASKINEMRHSKRGSRSRGLGASKPGSSDDSDWESASEDEGSSDDADSVLAYGTVVSEAIKPTMAAAAGAATGAAVAAASHHSSEDPRRNHQRRKSSVVDPTLFGPVNSLRGMVNTPCGFGNDQGAASSYVNGSQQMPQSSSASTDRAPMRNVYPIPTSDPGKFDADRSSVTSLPRDAPQQQARPAPVPIQQPVPKTPISPKVYDAERLEDSERRRSRLSRRDSSEDGSGLGKAALAGAAGAAVAASVMSDRKHDSRDTDDKRRKEKRDAKSRKEKDEKRDRKHRDEYEREKDRSSSKRDSYSSKYDGKKDKHKERKRSSRHEDLDELPHKKREVTVDHYPGQKSYRRGEDEIQVEYDPDARSEISRSSRRKSRGDDPDSTRDLPQKEIVVSKRDRVDPFQFQVSDDSPAPGPIATERPFTPTVVTVDREPNFDSYSPPRSPYQDIRVSRRDSFEIQKIADDLRSSGRDPSTTKDPRMGHEYEEEEHEARSIYEQSKQATVPIAAAAIASAIAVEEERSRERRRGDYSRDGSRDRARAEKDAVQEEADRYYRESVIARKIASQEIRSRSTTPDKSVVDKWAEKDGDGDDSKPKIVTPPGMEDAEKHKSRFGPPNADVRIDNDIFPKETHRFRTLEGDLDPQEWKSRDPSCERDRPLLNLVRPTPVSSRQPTPTPEAREPEPVRDETSSSVPEDIVIGPRGDIVRPQIPSSSKSVTWGENETKSYEVESPDHKSDTELTYSRSDSSSKQRPRLDKSSNWGILAAAIAGSSSEPVNEPDIPRSESPKSTDRDLSSFSSRDMVPTGPEQIYMADDSSAPPVPGPKPTMSRSDEKSGGYSDDIEFAGALAAGLQDTGFDPNIVIDDPTYRRRESPPGSDELNGNGLYQKPYSETVTDLGVYSQPQDKEAPELDVTKGEDEGTIAEPETPVKLSKKEKKRLEKLAKRQSAEITDSPNLETAVFEDAVESPEKLSEREQRKRDKKNRKSREIDDGEVSRVSASEPWSNGDSFKDADAGDEREGSKVSRRRSKRESTGYDSPSRSRSAAPSEVSIESSSRKSKKSKRRSGDNFDPYGDGPPGSSRDPFEDREVSSVVSESRGDSKRDSKHKRRSSRYDDDDTKSVTSAPGTARRSKELEKRPSSIFSSFFKSKDDSKKDSFLDNAGTLGASVGLAGAAVAVASELAHHNAAEASPEKKDQATESWVQSVDEAEAFDPEIVPRAIKPAIDPQYGDLLPLPPSEPGTPSEPPEELPTLPDSRPNTPPDEHLRREYMSHQRRRSNHEMPPKSPSQTAIPIQLRLRQKSMPTSPNAVKASPASSPVVPTDSWHSPKRAGRPTSWESSREIKPLRLLEGQRHGPHDEFDLQGSIEDREAEGQAPNLDTEPKPHPGHGLRIDSNVAPMTTSDIAGSHETTPKAEYVPGFDLGTGLMASAGDRSLGESLLAQDTTVQEPREGDGPHPNTPPSLKSNDETKSSPPGLSPYKSGQKDLSLPESSEEFLSADEHFSDALDGNTSEGPSEDMFYQATEHPWEPQEDHTLLEQTPVEAPMTEVPFEATADESTADEWNTLSAKEKKKAKKARKKKGLAVAEPSDVPEPKPEAEPSDISRDIPQEDDTTAGLSNDTPIEPEPAADTPRDVALESDPIVAENDPFTDATSSKKSKKKKKDKRKSLSLGDDLSEPPAPVVEGAVDVPSVEISEPTPIQETAPELPPQDSSTETGTETNKEEATQPIAESEKAAGPQFEAEAGPQPAEDTVQEAVAPTSAESDMKPAEASEAAVQDATSGEPTSKKSKKKKKKNKSVSLTEEPATPQPEPETPTEPQQEPEVATVEAPLDASLDTPKDDLVGAPNESGAVAPETSTQMDPEAAVETATQLDDNEVPQEEPVLETPPSQLEAEAEAAADIPTVSDTQPQPEAAVDEWATPASSKKDKKKKKKKKGSQPENILPTEAEPAADAEPVVGAEPVIEAEPGVEVEPTKEVELNREEAEPSQEPSQSVEIVQPSLAGVDDQPSVEDKLEEQPIVADIGPEAGPEVADMPSSEPHDALKSETAEPQEDLAPMSKSKKKKLKKKKASMDVDASVPEAAPEPEPTETTDPAEIPAAEQVPESSSQTLDVAAPDTEVTPDAATEQLSAVESADVISESPAAATEAPVQDTERISEPGNDAPLVADTNDAVDTALTPQAEPEEEVAVSKSKKKKKNKRKSLQSEPQTAEPVPETLVAEPVAESVAEPVAEPVLEGTQGVTEEPQSIDPTAAIEPTDVNESTGEPGTSTEPTESTEPTQPAESIIASTAAEVEEPSASKSKKKKKKGKKQSIQLDPEVQDVSTEKEEPAVALQQETSLTEQSGTDTGAVPPVDDIAATQQDVESSEAVQNTQNAELEPQAEEIARDDELSHETPAPEGDSQLPKSVDQELDAAAETPLASDPVKSEVNEHSEMRQEDAGEMGDAPTTVAEDKLNEPASLVPEVSEPLFSQDTAPFTDTQNLPSSVESTQAEEAMPGGEMPQDTPEAVAVEDSWASSSMSKKNKKKNKKKKGQASMDLSMEEKPAEDTSIEAAPLDQPSVDQAVSETTGKANDEPDQSTLTAAETAADVPTTDTHVENEWSLPLSSDKSEKAQEDRDEVAPVDDQPSASLQDESADKTEDQLPAQEPENFDQQAQEPNVEESSAPLEQPSVGEWPEATSKKSKKKKKKRQSLLASASSEEQPAGDTFHEPEPTAKGIDTHDSAPNPAQDQLASTKTDGVLATDESAQTIGPDETQLATSVTPGGDVVVGESPSTQLQVEETVAPDTQQVPDDNPADESRDSAQDVPSSAAVPPSNDEEPAVSSKKSKKDKKKEKKRQKAALEASSLPEPSASPTGTTKDTSTMEQADMVTTNIEPTANEDPSPVQGNPGSSPTIGDSGFVTPTEEPFVSETDAAGATSTVTDPTESTAQDEWGGFSLKTSKQDQKNKKAKEAELEPTQEPDSTPAPELEPAKQDDDAGWDFGLSKKEKKKKKKEREAAAALALSEVPVSEAEAVGENLDKPVEDSKLPSLLEPQDHLDTHVEVAAEPQEPGPIEPSVDNSKDMETQKSVRFEEPLDLDIQEDPAVEGQADQVEETMAPSQSQDVENTIPETSLADHTTKDSDHAPLEVTNIEPAEAAPDPLSSKSQPEDLGEGDTAIATQPDPLAQEDDSWAVGLSKKEKKKRLKAAKAKAPEADDPVDSAQPPTTTETPTTAEATQPEATMSEEPQSDPPAVEPTSEIEQQDDDLTSGLSKKEKKKKKKKEKKSKSVDIIEPQEIDQATVPEHEGADGPAEGPQDEPAEERPAVESEAQPEPEPEPEVPLESEAQIGPEAQPEPEGQQEPEAQPEPEVQQESEVRPEPEAKAESQVQPETEGRLEPEVQPGSEVQPEPDVRSELEAQPDSEAQPGPEVQQESEVQPESDAKPQPEVQAESAIQSEPEPRSEREIQPEPVIQLEPEVTPEAEVQPKSEIQTEPPADIEQSNDDPWGATLSKKDKKKKKKKAKSITTSTDTTTTEPLSPKAEPEPVTSPLNEASAASADQLLRESSLPDVSPEEAKPASVPSPAVSTSGNDTVSQEVQPGPTPPDQEENPSTVAEKTPPSEPQHVLETEPQETPIDEPLAQPLSKKNKKKRKKQAQAQEKALLNDANEVAVPTDSQDPGKGNESESRPDNDIADSQQTDVPPVPTAVPIQAPDDGGPSEVLGTTDRETNPSEENDMTTSSADNNPSEGANPPKQELIPELSPDSMAQPKDLPENTLGFDAGTLNSTTKLSKKDKKKKKKAEAKQASLIAAGEAGSESTMPVVEDEASQPTSALDKDWTAPTPGQDSQPLEDGHGDNGNYSMPALHDKPFETSFDETSKDISEATVEPSKGSQSIIENEAKVDEALQQHKSDELDWPLDEVDSHEKPHLEAHDTVAAHAAPAEVSQGMETLDDPAKSLASDDAQDQLSEPPLNEAKDNSNEDNPSLVDDADALKGDSFASQPIAADQPPQEATAGPPIDPSAEFADHMSLASPQPKLSKKEKKKKKKRASLAEPLEDSSREGTAGEPSAPDTIAEVDQPLETEPSTKIEPPSEVRQDSDPEAKPVEQEFGVTQAIEVQPAFIPDINEPVSIPTDAPSNTLTVDAEAEPKELTQEVEDWAPTKKGKKNKKKGKKADAAAKQPESEPLQSSRAPAEEKATEALSKIAPVVEPTTHIEEAQEPDVPAPTTGLVQSFEGAEDDGLNIPSLSEDSKQKEEAIPESTVLSANTLQQDTSNDISEAAPSDAISKETGDKNWDFREPERPEDPIPEDPPSNDLLDDSITKNNPALSDPDPSLVETHEKDLTLPSDAVIRPEGDLLGATEPGQNIVVEESVPPETEDRQDTPREVPIDIELDPALDTLATESSKTGEEDILGVPATQEGEGNKKEVPESTANTTEDTVPEKQAPESVASVPDTKIEVEGNDDSMSSPPAPGRIIGDQTAEQTTTPTEDEWALPGKKKKGKKSKKSKKTDSLPQTPAEAVVSTGSQNPDVVAHHEVEPPESLFDTTEEQPEIKGIQASEIPAHHEAHLDTPVEETRTDQPELSETRSGQEDSESKTATLADVPTVEDAWSPADAIQVVAEQEGARISTKKSKKNKKRNSGAAAQQDTSRSLSPTEMIAPVLPSGSISREEASAPEPAPDSTPVRQQEGPPIDDWTQEHSSSSKSKKKQKKARKGSLQTAISEPPMQETQEMRDMAKDDTHSFKSLPDSQVDTQDVTMKDKVPETTTDIPPTTTTEPMPLQEEVHRVEGENVTSILEQQTSSSGQDFDSPFDKGQVATSNQLPSAHGVVMEEAPQDKGEIDPNPPVTPERSPKQEARADVAADIATGGVALLAEKFGGVKKKKSSGKKTRIEDKRQPQEDIFDDPALWESADKKQVEVAEDTTANDDGFWTAGAVDREQTNPKTFDDGGESRDIAVPLTESLTGSESGWKETARQGARLDADDTEESPVLGRGEHGMDLSGSAGLLRRSSAAEEPQSGLLKEVPERLPGLENYGFSGNEELRLSPARSLPAVPEIPEAETEDGQDISRTPRLHHEKEYATDSPSSPTRRGDLSRDAQLRGSSAVPGEWSEDLARTPEPRERKLGKSPIGTPILRGPEREEEATPDPEKKPSRAIMPQQQEQHQHQGEEDSKGESEKANSPRRRGSGGGLAMAAAIPGTASETKAGEEPFGAGGQRSVSDNYGRALGSPRPEPGPVARRSVSNMSLSRQRTPEPLKFSPEDSGILRNTPTPPLRRVDKRMSGDLRAAKQRQQNNSTPPVANESRVRPKDMADVYDGFGEGRIGSPRSPTRPHSMRRRQSMQVLELESRVDQLMAENRLLTEARTQAEQSLGQQNNSLLLERDNEIDSLKQSLQYLQNEVARLTEVNDGLASANAELANQDSGRYADLEVRHADIARELTETRGAYDKHNRSLEEKDAEIANLRSQLEAAKEQVRDMQRQILASKAGNSDFLSLHDEDYFDHRCQQLCSHVQQWVLRFSKFSDMRACRLTNEISDEKTIDRLDNAVLDGTDVDAYLNDRVKRRDIFMSMTMNMIWEFVFTRYLFGMDREQRQKLKSLEKLLMEVGPHQAVRQWRAVTLTLLCRRDSFKQQRDQDTEAVVQAVFQTLCKILPPPGNLENQIQSQLRRVMREAVELSIEMRIQKAEYMMLPPLQPEYDSVGELSATVKFNASMMNERSSSSSMTNEELEAQGAVVRVVLFPLVVKKGDDDGVGDEEIVVCPAQVLIARSKGSRHFAPSSDAGGASLGARSHLSLATEHMGHSEAEGGM